MVPCASPSAPASSRSLPAARGRTRDLRESFARESPSRCDELDGFAVVSERMATAGARAKARREDLKVMSVDGKACVATCPERDDEAARKWREACKQR